MKNATRDIIYVGFFILALLSILTWIGGLGGPDAPRPDRHITVRDENGKILQSFYESDFFDYSGDERY